MTIEELREEYDRTKMYRGPDRDRACDHLIAALTATAEELTAEVERLEDEIRSLAKGVYDG